jgi:sugar/nucleoside kinase (ribokinase family)
MKVLVIGKPVYNVILSLQNFVSEGAKYNLKEKLEMGGGAVYCAATLLNKWNTPVYFNGVVGSDAYGNKIKSELEGVGVNTKYIEINYEHPTGFNYILINNQNGSSTQIIVDNPDINLTKYKYDFIPDYIIMDGTDPAGSIAALNNFPKAISILFANKVSETVYNISKRCSYVVANMGYAKALAKMDLEFNKTKSLVNFMQKIKDLNKAQYIITLKEKGVLYVSDNKVKMLPAIKLKKIIDDTNSGNMFFGAFCFGLINNYGIDLAVKIANITGGLAMTKLGCIDAVPNLSEVLRLAGIKEENIDNNQDRPEETAPEIIETNKENPAPNVSQ